jgi:putative ABC transport system substrate-binding protein
MKRREFIALVAGVAASPLLASAQRPAKLPRVGILNYAEDDDIRVRQFRAALRELGYIEDKNIWIGLRSAGGMLDQLPPLAEKLVADKVDVIVALGPAVWAAKRATTTIPIIIAFSGDPVGDGVVTSLARPGGNLTGFSYMSTDLAAKRLQLFSEAFSRNKRIGALYNTREPATKHEMESTLAAGRSMGVTVIPIAVQDVAQLEEAFQTAVAENTDGLIVFTHGFAVLSRARIMELAASHRLPVLYGWRDFVDEGGLMSYGPDIEILVRKAAIYVDRVIKGANPSDLPIEQPTRLQLVVNLKTAKAQGLTIPPAVLARADDVIE